MKSTASDKQVWVRVPQKVHTALKTKREKNGIKISALIRMLIMKYLEGEIVL